MWVKKKSQLKQGGGEEENTLRVEQQADPAYHRAGRDVRKTQRGQTP